MKPSANPKEERPGNLDVALLLLRVTSALAFLYHGSAILFGFFGGPGPERFAVQHHWPVILGYLVGLAQVAGGLTMATGVLIRAGAASIAVVMLGAIFMVHLPHGFDVNNGGMEYALTQLFIALALLLTGPRRLFARITAPRPLQRYPYAEPRIEKKLTDLVWERRATPAFNCAPIRQEDLNWILRAGLEAPSSYNMQPWRFVVVSDPEQRKRLRAAPCTRSRSNESPWLSWHAATPRDGKRTWKRLSGSVVNRAMWQRRGLKGNGEA